MTWQELGATAMAPDSAIGAATEGTVRSAAAIPIAVSHADLGSFRAPIDTATRRPLYLAAAEV